MGPGSLCSGQASRLCRAAWLARCAPGRWPASGPRASAATGLSAGYGAGASRWPGAERFECAGRSAGGAGRPTAPAATPNPCRLPGSAAASTPAAPRPGAATAPARCPASDRRPGCRRPRAERRWRCNGRRAGCARGPGAAPPGCPAATGPGAAGRIARPRRSASCSRSTRKAAAVAQPRAPATRPVMITNATSPPRGPRNQSFMGSDSFVGSLPRAAIPGWPCSRAPAR